MQINWGLNWSHSEHESHAEGGAGQASYSLLPYSVGLLQAYAEAHLPQANEVRWLLPVFERMPVADAAAQLRGAEVVGASIYVWNVRGTLAVIAELKRQAPDTLIVLGGPQVPDRAEAFLRATPDIDVVCHGEGEPVFTAILSRAADRDWDGIPGVSYLDADGCFHHHPPAPRTRELDSIPSPYLAEVFTPLITAHPQKRWVATWETNRGCPFSCTFCDWGSATAAKVNRFDMGRLQQEIDWFSARQIGFVLCADANFGMLPRDVEIAQAVVDAKERSGFPFSLSIQNAKNSTERTYQIQRLLHQHLHTIGVTLSLQSANPQTLANIRRANIRSSSFTELQRRYLRDGIYTYTDLIIGLPGESYAAFADSVSQVIADGQHNHIQFHNCQVLPNAEMGDPAYQERFGIVTVPQAIRSAYAPADERPDVDEYCDTVISTTAMPPADWVRVKVFAWMTDLVYFDRLLQIPLLVMGQRHGLRHRRLLEAFTEADPQAFPLLAWATGLLAQQAARIQQGEIEYITEPRWGNILWPGDQYLYLRLVADGRLEAFYAEARRALAALLPDDAEEETILEEAFTLNGALLRLPGRRRDSRLVLSHDLLGYWQAGQQGENVALDERLAVYRVRHSERQFDSLGSWAEFLTWCQGRDKREYLAPATPLRSPLAVA